MSGSRPTRPTKPRVLYYAHDHGSGHVRHAANMIRTDAFHITVATAHPRATDLLPHGTRVASLPSDVVPGYGQPAGSALHYTPAGPVTRERFTALLDAARGAQADVAVVDVSVEAALFLKLAGYPVVHRRMHGLRTDTAHRLVYGEASGLFAHYGPALEDPAWLERYGERTTFLGVPDLTGRLRSPAVPVDTATPRNIGVIVGTGGGGVAAADLARAARTLPGAAWHVHGPVSGVAASPLGDRLPENLHLHGWTDDVVAAASRSDVVVVSAGHNAVVDGLRTRRPLVLATEPRPFDEHVALARAVQRAAGVPWCAWQDPGADWAHSLTTAHQDPSSVDRLAAALLTPPAEYRSRWQQAVRRAMTIT